MKAQVLLWEASHHQHCKERQMWAGALYGAVVDFCLTAKCCPVHFSFKEKRATNEIDYKKKNWVNCVCW